MTDAPTAAAKSSRRRRRRQAQAETAEQAPDGATAATGATAGSAAPVPPAYQPRPPARPARTRPRHWGLVFAFLLMVVAPVGAAGWYLYERAVDQYASTLGFTVRSEDVSSAIDVLGGLGNALGGGGGGGSDSDILYEFIRSQELVEKVDARLDLRGLYSRHAARDPLLSFDANGTIEDLTAYWRRMVRVSYDGASGLIELRVLAFAPDEAQAVAEAIYDESSVMINALSAIARADATRYAQEDLDLALERLKAAREALTAFRLQNQIVDPNADIQTQIGLLATLQEQQASALIEYELLAETAREGDPRLETARRRLEIIEEQVAEERQKFGAGGVGPGGQEYATTISEFERLTVEREFAETAYAAALSALDGARAEANRQSRYLAAYIRPTLAERAEFPQRALILGLVTLFAFLAWAILSLVLYALRDRR